MIQNRVQSIYLIVIVLVLVLLRLVPHPPNAVPIAAMALFAGAYFSNRFLAYLVPLAAMLISDILIGFHSTISYVYAGTALTVLIGSMLQKVSFFKVGIAAIISTLVFFLITNFGAWLHHDMYARDFTGLVQAYMAGLPFVRNALIANLIFSYLVFYGFKRFLSLQSTLKCM